MKRILIYILLILLFLTGCQTEESTDETPREVETLTVARQDITLREVHSASIEGCQTVKILPRIEGYLKEIRVKEGQRVRRGQVLFVLDQSAPLAEVKAAEAQVAVAKAAVEQAQLNYDSRKTLYDRQIVSDFDLRSAHSQLSLAQAQCQQSEAQWEAARTQLSYTQLVSPSDGVVGSLPYRVGDLVSPTMQSALTTVADTHQMYVYFSLSEREVLDRLSRQGTLPQVVASFPPVRLVSVNGDTCAVQGRVESLSGVVESATGALTARAVFDNAEGRLLSGTTGRIVVPNELKQVIVVPQSATYQIQDKVYVYRVEQGRAASTIITVMPNNDGQHYVVTSGLTEGDVIVAKGAAYVREGQEIVPVKAPKSNS